MKSSKFNAFSAMTIFFVSLNVWGNTEPQIEQELAAFNSYRDCQKSQFLQAESKQSYNMLTNCKTQRQRLQALAGPESFASYQRIIGNMIATLKAEA